MLDGVNVHSFFEGVTTTLPLNPSLVQCPFESVVTDEYPPLNDIVTPDIPLPLLSLTYPDTVYVGFTPVVNDQTSLDVVPPKLFFATIFQ